MLEARDLEAAYLESQDPVVQSGFHGGRQRWVAERSPLVDGIHRNGTFLDVGCANGLLAADVVDWARQRGFQLVPHGVDLGARLVALARERLPGHADNFAAADAWSWDPDRQWTFVYSLLDLSPIELWCDWLHRLFGWVELGGRLIVGSYGSKSRGELPLDVAGIFEGCGLDVAGSSAGGARPWTRFAWANKG
jgi:trans-aconitate methyltransferase